MTSTDLSNVTRTVIVSATSKVSPLTGLLVIVTSLTVGVVCWLPSTLWLVELATAWVPRPSVASVVPPLILMVPPFNVSALAPMLMPSESLSDDCTT